MRSLTNSSFQVNIWIVAANVLSESPRPFCALRTSLALAWIISTPCEFYTQSAHMATSRGAQIAARLLSRGSGKLPHAKAVLHTRNAPYECSIHPLSPCGRYIHTAPLRKAQAAVAEAQEETWTPPPNAGMAFPCLDAIEAKTEALQNRSFISGPEPSYTSGKHLLYRSNEPILLHTRRGEH
jgi:hypothetical protein